jgi:class 3 adenylate cyclase
MIELLVVVLVGAVLGVCGVAVARTRALHDAQARIEELEAEVRRLTPPETPTEATVRRTRGVARQAAQVVTQTAGRLRHGGVVHLVSSSLDDLRTWVTADRSAITQIAAPDGTVTIFFSDIEDSTPLNEHLGDKAWVKLLRIHEQVITQEIRRHSGHVVKGQGDGFMVVFPHPSAAALAAIAIQQRLRQPREAQLKRHPIRVRIGIHQGPVVSRDGDYYGLNVALAARIAGRAAGGEVLVSDDLAQNLLRSGLDVQLVALPPVELKGIAEPQALWHLATLA